MGLGGGCHWCTEAVFQSLRGVIEVDQGYIASQNENSSFSEAVVVHYDSEIIPLKTLIEIHLLTHHSTSDHSFRDVYRSAIYVYDAIDFIFAKAQLKTLQRAFKDTIITKVCYFKKFKKSRIEIRDYYKTDPNRPFCERYISPKLELLRTQFSSNYKQITSSSF